METDIYVTKFIPGGQSLATIQSGKKLFLWNALPGEIVTRVKITKEKSSFAEGIAEEFAKISPKRIPPRDACFLATSPWQILDYDYELEQKREILCEIFRQHKLDFDVAQIPCVKTDGNDFHYRNKMEYSLYYSHDDAKIHPAFHGRSSHAKIPVAKSSLERPEIWEKAQEIIAELNLKHEDARKFQSLLLRCNKNGEVSGGLYENGKKHPVFANLSDEILDASYNYSPNGFFQINLPVYEMALRDIASEVKTKKVLDLYAGVGTIGLSVARDKKLTLVECDKSAFRELEENCRRVELDECSSEELPQATAEGAGCATPATAGGRDIRSEEGYSASSTLRPIFARKDGLATGSRRESKVASDEHRSQIRPLFSKSEDTLDFIAPDQTVIVDPPRAGCDAKLLAKFLEVEPPTIIYLSCNPATQARDVAILSEKYRIAKVQPYNFFPRTPHLENLIILERK